MANFQPDPPQNPSGAYYPAPQPYGGLQAPALSYPPLQPYGGLQPQSGNPAQAAPLPSSPYVRYADQPAASQPSKLFAYIYMILAAAIIILSAVDIELHFWIRLCGGLVSLTHIYWSNINGSFDQIRELYCDLWNSPSECGNMCDNLQTLQSSGQVMRGMGITAAVCTGICLLLILLILLRPNITKRIQIIVRLAMCATAIIWAVGTFLYLGFFFEVVDDATDSSINLGLLLALAITILQIINCVLGNLAVTRLTPSN